VTIELTEAEKAFDDFIRSRREQGRKTYGQGLDHRDTRWNWERMALEELGDACQYLIAETKRLRDELEVVRALHDTQTAMLGHELGVDARDPRVLLARVRALVNPTAQAEQPWGEQWIGPNVLAHRLRMGMTQTQLAEQVGITDRTIRAIETGHGSCPARVLVALAVAFHVELGDLFKAAPPVEIKRGRPRKEAA
jgi:DNA-binding XRE family transcriptional regulator